MAGHLFISYSRLDGQDVALNLANDLEAGPEGYRVWLDQREVRRTRQDWDDQLTEAIQTCGALLFIMTQDSVRVGSGCKDEWVWALRYKRPVIPIRVDGEVNLPFRLGSRQFVDFAESSVRGMAQLRGDLHSLRTPEGQLRELRVRLAEAERELSRASAEQRPRIDEELGELRRRIEEQQQMVQSPGAIVERTEARIEAGMEREREPERPVVAPARTKFVNPPPMTAPRYFQDRRVESELIGAFLLEDAARMLSVVGRGGVGKTAMVCRLLKALEAGQLPDDLGELSVDGIVYLSPLGHPVSFPNLFRDMCRLVTEDVAELLLARYRDPQETPAALMRALLEAFATGRTVVFLDNFEELVDGEAVGLTDAALDEALRATLTAPAHGVKVIITTRVTPRDLLLVQPGVHRRVDLDEGLPSPYAEEVLRARDPDGRLGVKDAPDALLADARERTRGFPRALEALVAILAADRDTTLLELLADTRGMPENVVEALVGEAFCRLDPLSQQVMQALAIFIAAVPPVAVDYLLQPFQPAIDSAPVLSRLVNMSFVRRDAGQYYLHQVDRDYALHRVPVGEASDHDEPLAFTQYALRHRAADYFEQIRTPRETWRNLNDLAPQLVEFDLRCQAGEYNTAAQVLLDIDFDFLMRWGHYRLVVELHERLQGRVTDRWTDGRTKDRLGICYAALGETRRAIQLHEEALAISREVGDRPAESSNLNNLGVCYWTLGDTRRAIDLFERALAISREIGDRQGESVNLTGLGNNYRELGEAPRAIDYYRQAMAIYQELGDPGGEGSALTGLGSIYWDLGEVQGSIECFRQALDIGREIGDRRAEGLALNNLGSAYWVVGEVRRAIDFYDQGLTIYREIGDRGGEGNSLGGLGDSYLALGDVDRAIDFHNQALAIRQEVGDRRGESIMLTSLGDDYSAQGEVRRAIHFCEQALAISQELGYRYGEVLALISLAHAYIDSGMWTEAVESAVEGVRVADEMGSSEGSSKARVTLATAHLRAGEYGAAHATAEEARGYDYTPMRDNVALILGIAAFRTGGVDAARKLFREVLAAVNALLAHTSDTYDELDNRALALCGLALVEDPDRTREARDAFRAARAVTCANGVVERVLGLFDVLATGDDTELLARVRLDAAGVV